MNKMKNEYVILTTDPDNGSLWVINYRQGYAKHIGFTQYPDAGEYLTQDERNRRMIDTDYTNKVIQGKDQAHRAKNIIRFEGDLNEYLAMKGYPEDKIDEEYLDFWKLKH